MQTSDSTRTIVEVLRESIAAGVSIFQGENVSRPLAALLSDAAQASHARFIDLKEQNKVLDYCKEDQVISVETGMTLGELASILHPNGQYLPLFAHKDLSLLDVINSGETGYFEHSFGLRTLILGLEVLLSNGDKIKTGGKVVKNVSGYDLTKLFLGARGTLGLPVKAHLRVYAKHEQTELLVVHGINISQLLALSSKIIFSGLPLAGLELIAGNQIKIVENFPADYLLVSISEHRDVMSELQPLLDALVQDAGASVMRVNESLREEVHLSLGDYFEWDFNILHSSISRKQMQAFLVALRACGAFQLLYLPGTGRVKVRFENATVLRQAIKSLTQSVCAGGVLQAFDDVNVAYADQTFEYRVERLAGNDAEIFKIKQEIKHKFDPDNKMNPLAKL